MSKAGGKAVTCILEECAGKTKQTRKQTERLLRLPRRRVYSSFHTRLVRSPRLGLFARPRLSRLGVAACLSLFLSWRCLVEFSSAKNLKLPFGSRLRRCRFQPAQSACGAIPRTRSVAFIYVCACSTGRCILLLLLVWLSCTLNDWPCRFFSRM